MARRAALEEPTINLTPLIDVVFVILIMFMVIAPLLELDQVELASGPAGSTSVTSVQDQSPIAIYVQSDNQIRYQQQIVTPKQLTALLMAARQRHPRATPQVYHDKKALFGTYQAVKNGVEAAGFERMDVILNPG
jgi:biopolymer transport protein ExbD